MPNYQQIKNRADETPAAKTVTVSAETLFLLLDLLDQASQRWQWNGYSDWDAVEQMVNQAIFEVDD